MVNRTAAIAAFAALLCCGCRPAQRDGVISALPRDTSQAFAVAEHAGLSEAAARHHLAIYWNGPAGAEDSERQIVLVEQAIRRGDMGIVLTPTAPFALDTVIQRALAHKIPVVILGAPIPLPANPYLSFVLTDVQRSGRLAAERIHRVVGDSGEIALTGLAPMSPGSSDMANAFETSLAGIAPGIRVVAKVSSTSTFGQAEMATEQILEEHPNLAAIYALDVAATRGAIAALRGYHGRPKVQLVGTDQTLDLLFLLRQGAIDSLIIQDMRGMGRQAVENIVAAREGRPNNPVCYREPVLLSRDNIDTDAMQQMLMMDWRPQR